MLLDCDRFCNAFFFFVFCLLDILCSPCLTTLSLLARMLLSLLGRLGNMLRYIYVCLSSMFIYVCTYNIWLFNTRLIDYVPLNLLSDYTFLFISEQSWTNVLTKNRLTLPRIFLAASQKSTYLFYSVPDIVKFIFYSVPDIVKFLFYSVSDIVKFLFYSVRTVEGLICLNQVEMFD